MLSPYRHLLKQYQHVVKILVLLQIMLLPLTSTACKTGWEVFELLSTNTTQTREVYETVVVSGCVVQEIQTVNCDAGTEDSLTFTLGGSVGAAGKGPEISLAPGIETTLGVGQSSGRSLTLPPAEQGFIYHYEVRKIYQVRSGQVLVRPLKGGQSQRVGFNFDATCQLNVVGNIGIEPCTITTTQRPTPTPNAAFTQPTVLPATIYPYASPTPINADCLLSLQYQLTNCTFVYSPNQMGENILCPVTMPNNFQHIFIQAVLINNHRETAALNGITAVLWRTDGGQPPIQNPIFTTAIQLEPGERLPLVISVLPETLYPGYDYQFQLKACLQDEPCAETGWQYIDGEIYRFYVAGR